MGLRGCKPGEGWNKHEWTKDEEDFIREHFHAMTNPQLAAALGLTLTLVRTKCYAMGLKHMEMEYWTKQQVAYLRKHYPSIGDKELASIFQARWPKNKGWSLKHIEKKRRYLNLKRTPAMLRAIKDRECAKGTYSRANKKMWLVRGVAAEGEIRYWKVAGGNRLVPFVKVGGTFRHWARWYWEQHNGPIAKGMNVVFKDGDHQNRTLENLCLLSDGQLSQRNALTSSTGLSDNYIAGIMTHGDPELRALVKQEPALIELKRKQLILNRTINEQASN